MLKLPKIIRVSHAVACPVVFILFYVRGRQGGMFKVMKNDRFIVSLTIQVFFLQIFAQVKQWLLLELHGIIRLLHLVLCPLLKPTKNFILLERLAGGVFKVTENDNFLVLLVIWLLFSKFLGRLGNGLLLCDRGQQGGVLLSTKKSEGVAYIGIV